MASRGAIWFFEAVTPDEYTVIVEGLRQCQEFSDLDLAFFLDHINHDETHRRELDEAISRITTTEGQRLRFEAGVTQARLLDEKDNLQKLCSRLRPSVESPSSRLGSLQTTVGDLVISKRFLHAPL